MSQAAKPVLLCCVALVVAALILRGNLNLDPPLPNDMPEGSRFIATGYDLDHNERKGFWISCHPLEDPDQRFCRVTDSRGTVIFQGNFLPVRTPADPGARPPGNDQLLWVAGPVEGSPVPVIPASQDTVLVPFDDRDALIDRWNRHAEDWHALDPSSR